MQYLSAIDSVDHQNVSAGGVRGTARQQHERRVLFQLLEIRSSCSSRWSEGVSGRLCTVTDSTTVDNAQCLPVCMLRIRRCCVRALTDLVDARNIGSVPSFARTVAQVTQERPRPCAHGHRMRHAQAVGTARTRPAPPAPASSLRCRCCCSRRSRRQGRAC